MTATDRIKKERAAASAPIKLGQWHADFTKVKAFSDANDVPILAVWTNGDSCGHCVDFELCLLDSKFKTWAASSGVAMWIGFNSDKSQADKYEGTGFMFSRKGTLYSYPFVRLYWKSGKVDLCKSGGTLTGDTPKGAAKLVKALKAALKNYTPKQIDATDAVNVAKEPDEYKVRLNEKLTTKQVNKILDAIDANDGYCPCQPRGAGTKCHCEDFVKNKKIGEPCICKIYVKQKK